MLQPAWRGAVAGQSPGERKGNGNRVGQAWGEKEGGNWPPMCGQQRNRQGVWEQSERIRGRWCVVLIRTTLSAQYAAGHEWGPRKRFFFAFACGCRTAGHLSVLHRGKRGRSAHARWRSMRRCAASGAGASSGASAGAGAGEGASSAPSPSDAGA